MSDNHHETPTSAPAESAWTPGKTFMVLLTIALGLGLWNLFFRGSGGGVDRKTFEAFEKTYDAKTNGLQNNIDGLKSLFETALDDRAKTLSGDTQKLREDYEKNKAATATNFKTLEEGAKATLTSVSKLTNVVGELAKEVEKLKTLPPPAPVIPTTPVAAPVVTSAAPVTTTGLPLSNQATASGPGPQRFLLDASASDQSVADGLDRIASQTKDRVAQSTLATAARALRGGLKVDPDVRLKLRIIAQGMSTRTDLAKDAGLVNDAYRALQP